MIPETRHKYLRYALMAGSFLAGVQTAIFIFLSRKHPELLDPQNGVMFLSLIAMGLSIATGFFAVKATKDSTWIHQGFNAPMQGLYAGLAAMLLATTINGLISGQWTATGGATPLFAALGGFVAKATTPSKTL